MKVYTLFVSKLDWHAGWPHIGFDNEQFKAWVLERLTKKFPEITFAGGEILTGYEPSEVERIKREIEGTDGSLLYIIGHYGYPEVGPLEGLLQSGQPTILANRIYGGDYVFIQLYERIRGKELRVLPVSSPDFEDIEWAIGILRGLHRLKGKKILTYAPDEITMSPEGLIELAGPDLLCMPEEEREAMMAVMGNIVSIGHYLDLTGADQAHQWRRDEEKYRRNMKEVFGLELIRRDPKELAEHYRKADEKKAEEIADRWIKEAKLVESPRQTVVNAARLYLAIEKLIEETGADSVTIDCGTLLIMGLLPAFPCLGFRQMLNSGFTATCEADLDSHISVLLGYSLTGRPGFVSNHTLDLTHNQVTYLHCMASSKPYGPEGPSMEYDIVRHGESHFVGAVPRVRFPVGEDLTTIKLSLLEKKLALRHGKIIGQIVDEKACVNKVLVEDDAEKILENYDWMTFGWHRVSFVGDWRREFKAAARLAGLKLVEEDKATVP
ncbi:MAG: hypothetical protein NZ653_00875 [Anaerolineae bacterium]|nr:hypothetical protein [Anaerolineae bacterium]